MYLMQIGNPFEGPESFRERMNEQREGLGEVVGNLSEGLGKLVSDKFLEVFGSMGGRLETILSDGLRSAELLETFKESFNPIKTLVAQTSLAIYDSFKSLGEAVGKSWNELDQAAFNFAKTSGLAKQQAEGLRDRILKLSRAGEHFGANYGKTLADVLKLQSDFSSAIGRTIQMTNSQLKDISALSAVVGDEMAVKFTAHLDNFGMSTTAAGELMTQMYNDSVKKGITLQAYSKNVVDNLHLAQQYNFKDGVKGLMSMAENATRMKMDMQQVVALANKVQDVESAVNMSAELQVLGGPFAQFGDPLGLLHDSLLDMDGLSDRLTELVGSLGYFDKNTGQIEMGRFDKIRLRQAAQVMGVDYGKMVESATHQAKRKEIDLQMAGLTNIPDEYKEFIMNTAQFQNGRAGITDKHGNFKDIASLSAEDIEEMARYAQTDSENIRDIAEMLRGALDVQKGQEAELENTRAEDNATKAERYKYIYNELAYSKDALKQLVEYQKITASLQAMSQVGGMVRNIAGMFGIKWVNGGMIKTHSEGDLITNGTPGREFVLNSAQYGEFIVNAASTKHHLALLRAINGDKHGQLRFKQYEDGGVIGMGFGASSMIPGMGGMGMIGNIYQLQMMGKLNEGIRSITTGSENFTRLDKLIKTQTNTVQQLQAQQTKLNKQFELQNRLANNKTMSSTARSIAGEYAAKTQAEMTKLQSKINTNQSRLTRLTANQEKIISRGRIMGGLATGGMSIMAGVSGYMSAKAQYEATGEAIMEKQKAQAGSVGKGIGSAAGAALGAFAGPIGMMIGSTVGGWIGQALGESIGDESQESMDATRDKLGNNLASTNALGSNKFLLMKGNYYSKEQQKIANALKDGHLYEDEIDEDLAKKIRANGNTNLIEKHARGGWIKGRTHAAGGEIIGAWEGKIHEAEDSEAIIPADKAKKSVNLVNGLLDGRYNDTSLTPIEPMGKQMKVNERYAQNRTPQSVKVEPITININGSIKLETDSKTFDITKEVAKSPILLNKIADLITKQFNIDDNFALDMKKFRKKYI